eukprot:7016870-Prymnesium_polylepis.1
MSISACRAHIVASCSSLSSPRTCVGAHTRRRTRHGHAHSGCGQRGDSAGAQGVAARQGGARGGARGAASHRDGEATRVAEGTRRAALARLEQQLLLELRTLDEGDGARQRGGLERLLRHDRVHAGLGEGAQHRTPNAVVGRRRLAKQQRVGRGDVLQRQARVARAGDELAAEGAVQRVGAKGAELAQPLQLRRGQRRQHRAVA